MTWFQQVANVRWAVGLQIVYLPITHSPPFACFLIALRPKSSSQHAVPRRPQPMFNVRHNMKIWSTFELSHLLTGPLFERYPALASRHAGNSSSQAFPVLPRAACTRSMNFPPSSFTHYTFGPIMVLITSLYFR
jgi:hypothetical protein